MARLHTRWVTVLAVALMGIVVPVNGRPVTALGAGSITGHVSMGPDPVTDATVELYSFFSVVATTTTDSNGDYAFTGLDVGDYRVLATSLSAGTRWHPTAIDGNEATFVSISDTSPSAPGTDITYPAGEVAGTVMFRGEPLPGAAVHLENLWGGIASTATVLTDASGHYRVRGVDPNVYDVIVNVSEIPHRVGEAVVTAANPIVAMSTLVLASGGVSGTVLRSDGSPVDNGSVVMAADFDRRYLIPVAAGAFSAVGIEPGDYTVTGIEAGLNEVTLGATVTVGTIDVSGIGLVLPAGGTISGTIQGTPVPMTQMVTATSLDRAHSRTGDVLPDGSFTISGLPDGDYRVSATLDLPVVRNQTVYAPGTLRQQSATIVHITAGSASSGVSIAPPPTASWSGTVQTSAGAPIASTVVYATWVRDNSAIGVALATTGADGRFQFDQLPTDQALTLQFNPPAETGISPQYLGGAADVTAAEHVVLTAGEVHEQGVTLYSPGSIEGDVIAPDGGIADGFAYAFIGDTWVGGIVTGGHYAIPTLKPGTYKVYIAPGFDVTDYAPRFLGDVDTAASATEVPVGEGETVASAPIHLEMGATIRGRISIANGQPVSAASVQLTGLPVPPFAYLQGTSVLTMPDGTYELRGVPSGNAVLRVDPPSDTGLISEWSGGVHEAAAATPMAIPAGSTQAGVDVVLDRGVIGKVSIGYQRDVRTIPPIFSFFIPVILCPAGSTFALFRGCSIEGGTGAALGNDPYSYLSGPAVPGRTYEARALMFLGEISPTGPVVPVTPAAGQEYRCVLPTSDNQGPAFCDSAPAAPTGTVTGRVVGPDGVGVEGVDVTLQSTYLGGRWTMPTKVTTGPGGYYTMPAVPRGRYAMLFTPPFTRSDLLQGHWSGTGSPDTNGPGAVFEMAPGGSVEGISIRYEAKASGSAVITEGGVPLGEAFARVVAMCVAPSEYQNQFFNCPNGPATLAFWNGSGYSFTTVNPGTYTIRGAEVFTGRRGAPVTLTLGPGDTFTCTLAIETDGVSSCDVISANDDADGVSSAMENAAPNGGDGNNDGVPDSAQPDVTSVADPTLPTGGSTSNYVTLVLAQPTPDAGYTLANVDVATPPADSAPPSGFVPQSGLLSFDVTGLPTPPEGSTTGSTVSLDVLLPAQADTYLKFDEVTRMWTDATELADFAPTSELIGGVERWRVTLSITDNGLGDTDPRFGFISDPGVFALRNSDTTAPVVTVSTTPVSADGSNGWFRSNVHVDWSVTEPESPDSLQTAGCTDFDVTTDQAPTTYTCTAASTGGIATPVSVSVARDATAPGVTWSGGPADGASYAYGTVPAAPSCTSVDALSGGTTCTVSGYATTVGTHVLTAAASDAAGNSATSTRTYTVTAWTLRGFAQPVDMGSVLNTVKGGSTVPLKFEVFRGTTELTDITAIRSLSSAEVSCSAGPTLEDAIETTVAGPSSLRYDTTSGQFVQNWTTPKSPGTCRRLTMTTQDGSTLVAWFKLR